MPPDRKNEDHSPYEEETAEGGAPRGYDANEERYDAESDEAYTKEAEKEQIEHDDED